MNRKSYIIIFILIVIIIILLFFTNIWKIEDNKLVPTGNVDVFDIDFDVTCTCENGKECDKNTESTQKVYKDKKTGKPLKVIHEDEEIDENEEITGEVFVDDKYGNYIYQEKLRIFDNAAYEFTNKIAPGVSNVYHFVVHNSAEFNVKYYLQMYELSEYDINLKYRLKRNNSYVVGDDNNWVTADKLKTEFSKLNSAVSDSYSLEWKWIYNDNKDNEDTLAGKNMTSEYKLNVRFYFEEV